MPLSSVEIITTPDYAESPVFAHIVASKQMRLIDANHSANLQGKQVANCNLLTIDTSGDALDRNRLIEESAKARLADRRET